MLSFLLCPSWSYFPILYRLFIGGRPVNVVINIPLSSVFAILIDALGEKASEGETGMIREFKEAEILCSSRKQNKYIFIKRMNEHGTLKQESWIATDFLGGVVVMTIMKTIMEHLSRAHSQILLLYLTSSSPLAQDVHPVCVTDKI